MTVEERELIFQEWKNRPKLPPSPPPGFDVNLNKLSTSYASKIWELVEGGAIDAYIRNGVGWVKRSELQHYISVGECACDPLSSAYIPFDD